MQWIDFDVNAAHALIQRCNAAAQALRNQGWFRRHHVENALVDFHGTYSTLFADACRMESEDRVRLAAALDDVSDKVRDVVAAARREEERLEIFHRQQSLGEENLLLRDVLIADELFYGRGPIPPPLIGVMFSPRERVRMVSKHSGNSKVSARLEAGKRL